MEDTLNEVLPWGLTLAQTLVIGGGVVLMLFALLILQTVYKIGRALFRLGLLLIVSVAGCAAVSFIAYNFAS